MADGMKPCKVCGKTVSPNAATCPDGRIMQRSPSKARRTGECGLGWEPCKVCGKTVSLNAKTCPHCGGEPKSLWSNPNSLPNKLAPVTLLIVMVLIGSIFGPDLPHPGSAPDNTRAGSLLIDVLAYIWPLLVGTVVLVGIVYFVFVRQGGVADDDDQDK
jgi:RNA polymerase subunit RPABC4/transcription elongation factor Spt4